MREIKFRGKRVDNGKWVYGYYVRCGNTHIIDVPITDRQNEAYHVLPETVGQYTGLKDKERKGICFESDHGFLYKVQK